MQRLYGWVAPSLDIPAQPLKEAHRSLLCSVLRTYYWCYWCDLSLARLEFGSFIWGKKIGSQCFTLQVVSAPSSPQEPTGPSLCGWGQLGPRHPGSARAIPEQFVMLKHQFPFISGQGFLGSGQLTQMEPQPCGLWSLKIKSARPQALIMSLSCPPLLPPG